METYSIETTFAPRQGVHKRTNAELDPDLDDAAAHHYD